MGDPIVSESQVSSSANASKCNLKRCAVVIANAVLLIFLPLTFLLLLISAFVSAVIHGVRIIALRRKYREAFGLYLSENEVFMSRRIVDVVCEIDVALNRLSCIHISFDPELGVYASDHVSGMSDRLCSVKHKLYDCDSNNVSLIEVRSELMRIIAYNHSLLQRYSDDTTNMLAVFQTQLAIVLLSDVVPRLIMDCCRMLDMELQSRNIHVTHLGASDVEGSRKL
ncbi:MAG: hypothetical protein ACTJLM_01635 [Ehrlichia sp.]